MRKSMRAAVAELEKRAGDLASLVEGAVLQAHRAGRQWADVNVRAGHYACEHIRVALDRLARERYNGKFSRVSQAEFERTGRLDPIDENEGGNNEQE